MASARKRHKSARKDVGFTTQRVDLDTLTKIKTLNYHLMKSGIRITQSEIIAYTVDFVMAKEADFLEYVSSGQITGDESAFDTLVRITGRPWFPYGNLLE